MRAKILKLLLLVVLLVATGFGSYKAVIAIWGEPQGKQMPAYEIVTGGERNKGCKAAPMLQTS